MYQIKMFSYLTVSDEKLERVCPQNLLAPKIVMAYLIRKKCSKSRSVVRDGKHFQNFPEPIKK